MLIDVSVVIPTFRRNQQLAEAIESVLRQEDVRLEVIVIDDCPSGGGEATVAGFRDNRITYLRNPNPTGGFPSIVRNLGWPRAVGRFVHFLDDDDMVPDGHYAAAMAAFAERPGVGLVFGRVEPFGDVDQLQLEHERRFFAEAARRSIGCGRLGSRLPFVAPMLFDLPLLVCSAALVRRECIAAVGGFDPTIRLMEDADFNARVMRRFGAHFLDRVALHYRIGFPSLMHAPEPSPAQLHQQREGRRLMRARYRAEHGALEFYTLAIWAKGTGFARRLMPLARAAGSRE
jgi:glycosyltransferase involved in cell wall biosynthesis